MNKRLTVGDLRKALEGVPDELEVRFDSDTEEAYEIILTEACRVKYELSEGKQFEDTCETGVDYFQIYGNAEEETYGNDCEYGSPSDDVLQRIIEHANMIFGGEE